MKFSTHPVILQMRKNRWILKKAFEEDLQGLQSVYEAYLQVLFRTETKTLFVITTDGMENASRKYTYEQVRRMIEAKKEISWEFLFLGANIDAAREAARFGISEDCAAN